MKIFVTGGAGYIGSELVEKLAAKDEISEVIVFDNLSRNNYDSFLGEKKKGHQKINFIKGDILDSRSLKELLKGIDVVYHLAAKVSTPFANTDPHFFEQVNHWGTAELVFAVEESEVKKFIYTSSLSVLGAHDDLVDEDTMPEPKTFYGISKHRGEQQVQRLRSKLDTYILRCGNVFGYSRTIRFDAVINKFVFEANFNHKLVIQGTGKQHRPFINIHLLTELLSEIPFKKIPYGIYHVLDKNYSILDIVDTLKEISPEIEFMFVNQHLKLRELKVDPNGALRQCLDYSNPKTLKEELTEFLGRFSY